MTKKENGNSGCVRLVADRPKAIVVGGSISGLCCTHALLSAGWEVTVIEKTRSPPTGNPTGAGLGLGSQARELLAKWISPDLIDEFSLPLAVDLNRGVDGEKKTSWTLSRDDKFGFRAFHWGDIYALLLESLPPGTILWGHLFLQCHVSEGAFDVRTDARILSTDEIVEITGNLVVAADGCHSSVRRQFMPDFKLRFATGLSMGKHDYRLAESWLLLHKCRYTGYTAWRGILDYSGKEDCETISGLRRSYDELGDCLYFDLASKTHCVLYELKNKRINWIWYINQPEPELEGNSVTMKTSKEAIEKMRRDAKATWLPEIAKIMNETEEPFINVIYDSDPLPRLFWDKVVLVGDAAHPTTPHGLRSTNMAILDAGVLGRCLEIWGKEDLSSALENYQSIRLPVVSKQVLHARLMGRIKQGLPLSDGSFFDATTATPEFCAELRQRKIPFFDCAPLAAKLSETDF